MEKLVFSTLQNLIIFKEKQLYLIKRINLINKINNNFEKLLILAKMVPDIMDQFGNVLGLIQGN